MRAADAVMLLLFTLGAAVQVNDPDPVRWTAVYALAAAACLFSLLRRIHWALPASASHATSRHAVLMRGASCVSSRKRAASSSGEE